MSKLFFQILIRCVLLVFLVVLVFNFSLETVYWTTDTTVYHGEKYKTVLYLVKILFRQKTNRIISLFFCLKL